MVNAIIKIYRWLFARVIFVKLNKILHLCSLHGLGILNFESDIVSGERAFLEKYLKNIPPGGCVIDVGANIGNYSKLVMDINPSLKLFAFEPHPKTYQKLSANIKRENYYPVNAAVSNKDGELSLFDYEAEDGSSHASLFKDVIENIHHAKSIEHRVKVVRLGDWLRNNNIERIELLKIDTEGNELNVLTGASEYICAGKIMAIHFEFNEMNISSRSYFRDFWDVLATYDLYRLLPHGMVRIERYSPVGLEIFAYQNIVALHKSRHGSI
jgi:FkbM family methyltransferase